jgi:hypothetical protein
MLQELGTSYILYIEFLKLEVHYILIYFTILLFHGDITTVFVSQWSYWQTVVFRNPISAGTVQFPLYFFTLNTSKYVFRKRLVILLSYFIHKSVFKVTFPCCQNMVVINAEIVLKSLFICSDFFFRITGCLEFVHHLIAWTEHAVPQTGSPSNHSWKCGGATCH